MTQKVVSSTMTQEVVSSTSTEMQHLTQLIFGFAATQTLLAADELQIFKGLSEIGPADSATLAAKLNLPFSSTLERLLNGCISHRLLQRLENGEYDLNDLSRNHLIEGKPGYMGGFFEHIRRDLYPVWQNLPHAVREARPQWSRVPGGNSAGPFETIYQNEEGLRSFMNAMFANSYGASCEHAARFDFTPFSHIADVGGASGAFLAAVLPLNPHLRGTIFDLAPVEKPALEVMQEYGIADRVSFHAGDFFKDPLPEGPDMFVLGHILHDWDEEAGTLLLQKIYNALPEGGAVFVAETLLNEDRTTPPMSVFMDLNMLVATTGRERTAAEYEQWLKKIGFTRTDYQVCDNPKSFVVGYK